MPDQLMRERSGDTGEVERRGRVLDHRQVPDLKDVPQVAGVRRGRRVRLVPGLVAGPPGELGERLAAVGVGVPPGAVGRDELGSGGGAKCVHARGRPG